MKHSVDDYKNYSYKACGACKHWHEWDKGKQKYELCLGDCDKVEKGRTRTDEDGETFKYYGYSFEDECYDDCFGCWEEIE